MLKPVRDIRDDLRDRLASIEEQEAQMAEALKRLGEQKAHYRRILEIEEGRYPLPGLLPNDPDTALPLAEFLIEALRTRPRTKEELREMAEQAGYFSDTDFPGRSIHATLTNLQRSSRVRVGRDEKYHVIPG